ncbi:MAG: tetratricopeptide repeat protein [Bryobacteraceae bacterium]
MRNRLLLLGAALAAFGISLFSGFHFDDYAIFSDPVLTSSSGWLGIWKLRPGALGAQPLTSLTFWLNYMAGGRDPLGYHLLNLALHLGAALLAYECLRRLLPERAALAAAAVFALHPIQAEAVNYVWGRSVLLAALFCLASLAAWLSGRRWMAVAWFAAALLANEQCAAFAMIPWWTTRNREGQPHGLFPCGAMSALAIAALARAAYAASAIVPAVSPGKFFLAEGLVIWRYLRLLVIPYGFTVDPDMRVPAVWLGALAWLAILAAALWAWRARQRGWTAWALAGLLLLLPSSSLLPAADFSADRRMYLPMFAFAAAAGLLLARVRTPALAACAAAALTLLSVVRSAVWLSDRSLWQEAVSRAPQKVRPKIQLSRSLPAAQALQLLETAENAAPHDPTIFAEMGKVLLAERQVEPALIQFGRALALDPGNAQCYNNRGVALALLGEYAMARADFRRALAIDPALTETRENLQKLPPEQ